MKFTATILLAAVLAAPTSAVAQDSTNLPSTAPSTDCSVSGGCNSTGTGSQPNTAPDSTLEGGTSGSGSGGSSGSGASGSGSGSGSGPLGNTGSGSTLDPGDSSGSSGSGSGGAAGPLNNTTPQ